MRLCDVPCIAASSATPSRSLLAIRAETGCAAPNHRPQASRQEQEHRQPRALSAPRQELDSPRGLATRCATAASRTFRTRRASRIPKQGHHRTVVPAWPWRQARDRASGQRRLHSRRQDPAPARRRRQGGGKTGQQRGRRAGRLRLRADRAKNSCSTSSTTSNCRASMQNPVARRARRGRTTAPAGRRKARRTISTWSVRCAARSAGGSRSAAPLVAPSCTRLRTATGSAQGRSRRPATTCSALEADIAIIARPHHAHSVHRSVRPALRQPREAADAVQPRP